MKTITHALILSLAIISFSCIDEDRSIKNDDNESKKTKYTILDSSSSKMKDASSSKMKDAPNFKIEDPPGLKINDYSGFSEELCECLDFHLSERASSIYANSNNLSELVEKFKAYRKEDPENALNDALYQMDFLARKDSCLKIVQENYKLTSVSEKTIINEAIKYYNKSNTCKDFVNLLKIGIKMN